jgi:hypothetical protein
MSEICQILRRSGRGTILVLTLVALLTLSFAAPRAVEALAGSIYGVVTDPEGLPPPLGTTVRLLKADHTTFGQASVDPGAGAFAFGAVPSGNYVLRAIPPAGSDLTPSQPRPVSVLGAPVDVGTVPLTEPSIVGTVYAPDGTTPAAAWVHVHSAGHAAETTPAPGGEIQIGGLPAGTYVLQAWPVDDQPFWASERLEVTVSPGLSQTVSLALTAADVVGRAVDPLGQPVKDAVARVIDASGQVAGRDLASATGFFAIGGLEPGSYRLALQPPWWEGSLLPPDAVPFSVPPPKDLGIIPFQASQKIVTGVIETNTSQPVVGALIDARRLDKAGQVHALSGAGGQYGLNLSAGLWSLTVRPVQGTTPSNWVYTFGPQWVHFQHDTSNELKHVEFRVITADSHVIGTVQMPDGSTPPFTVTVGIHTDAGIGRSQEIDPAGGSFDIPLPHGAYKVTIVAADPEYMGPPVAPIRVLPNSTNDLGTLTLLERNAIVSGTVADADGPLDDVPVMAWRPGAPGWAHTRTGPDGSYVLPVVKGTWLVKPAPEPGQPWLHAGDPREVEVPDGGHVPGVDFVLMAADAEILGTVVDEHGAPVTDLEGWVQATHRDDPAIQKGTPLRDGAFRLLVPGGRFRVSLKLPPGTPWLAPAAQVVDIGSGGVEDLIFVLRLKDAAIAGALWDSREEVVITGAEASVTAFSEGAWARTAVNPGNGAYRLGVAAGIWALGYRLDPGSGYVALRHRENYPVASGQTVPAPLPVAARDGLIAGVVRDPGGAPLAGATIVADGLGGVLGDVSLRTLSGDDGRFRLLVPHGHYVLRATIHADTNWIHPASLNVAVPDGGTVTGLVLAFREPDATLSGTVTLEGGTDVHGGPVHLWAYSPHDGYTRAWAELGGLYSLDVLSNTVWFVGAAYQEGNSYWAATARVEVPTGGATLDLVLHGPHPLPAPVTVRFDASQEQYVELSDGTSIYIPPGAMPVSGTVTLHVTPIATFPHQRHANVYRYGYAFTAADEHGQPIEQEFNQEVLIVFPYDEAELQGMGISEQALKPAYFSTTTDSWTFPQSYVVDTAHDLVAMEIDHFTDFALTGTTAYRVLLPLVIR